MAENLAARLISDYVADIVARTHALEDLATRLSLSQDYVSVEAPQLIQKFAEAARILRFSVLQELQRFRRTGDGKDLTLLRSIDRTIQEVFLDLRLPERARSDRVPGVLTRLVSQKASQIVPGAAVVLRPQWHYNYKIYREDVQSRYRQLFRAAFPSIGMIDEWLSGLPNPLFIISFPLLEQKSIQMHALLGHELGHLMARAYSAPVTHSAGFEKKIRDTKLGTRDGKRSKTNGSRTQQLLENDADIERALIARQVAIKEYAADAASIYLIGLPALFATAQLAMGRSPRHARESQRGAYPTWGNRLVFMLAQIEEAGWLDGLNRLLRGLKGTARDRVFALVRRIDDIRSWVGVRPQWKVPDRWLQSGHASAQSLVPDIRQFLSMTYARCFASVEDTISALPTLLARILSSLPPDNTNERELPFVTATLEQILLASWCCSLSDPEATFEADDFEKHTHDRMEMLRRLTMKAVENVDFVDRFRT